MRQLQREQGNKFREEPSPYLFSRKLTEGRKERIGVKRKKRKGVPSGVFQGSFFREEAEA